VELRDAKVYLEKCLDEGSEGVIEVLKSNTDEERKRGKV